MHEDLVRLDELNDIFFTKLPTTKVIYVLGTNVLPQNSHFLVGLILFDIAMLDFILRFLATA